MITLTDRQEEYLNKFHELPQAYRNQIREALRDAFEMGHNSDCMKMKHKDDKK